jgi:hypothetical protein
MPFEYRTALRTIVSVVTISVILLTGCATTANYERILSSWVGADADHLVRSWGPPTRSFPLSNGGQVFVYDRGGSSTFTTPVQVEQDPGMFIGNMYYPGQTTVTGGQVYNIRHSCRTQFEVNSSNRIVSWRWEGNSCVAQAPKETGEQFVADGPTEHVEHGCGRNATGKVVCD